MKGDIVILDLGIGNLRSVLRAFQACGANAKIIADADAVTKAHALVVPGQGAFGDCIRGFETGGMGEAVVSSLKKGIPYFGICLGMQALFESSEEAPDVRGLGWFKGSVAKFSTDMRDINQARLKIPHMGWNEVLGRHAYLPPSDWYYFVHSYYCVPQDPSLIAGAAEYGFEFCAAVAKDNVFACQFHPEKSHKAGQMVIQRFLDTL